MILSFYFDFEQSELIPRITVVMICLIMLTMAVVIDRNKKKLVSSQCKEYYNYNLCNSDDVFECCNAK